MLKRVLKWIGALLLGAAIIAGYVGLALLGTTPFELVLTTVMILMVVVVGALVIHLRALHRALFQHAQIAYRGFVLDFFLSLRSLLRERREEGRGAENDLLWNLIESYFRRETELYNTVVEELWDKTSMMHMLERGRIHKEAGLGDPRPIEPLYAELQELLGRLRDERVAREEARAASRGSAEG